MSIPSENYTDRVILFRGDVIEWISICESCMDLYISAYFTDDKYKRDQIINIILGTHRVTLESKRQMYDYIIESNFPDDWIKYKPIRKIFQKIIEERNVIAHYSVEANTNNDGAIIFTKYKNVKSQKIYSELDQKNLIKNIIRCGKIIIALAKRWHDI